MRIFLLRPILLASATALFIACGPGVVAEVDATHGDAGDEQRWLENYQLPEKLGAPLAGFPNVTHDTAGTQRGELSPALRRAGFLAFDGRKLLLHEESDDDDHESFDPSEGSGAFWTGRFRPIFAKPLVLPSGKAGVAVSLRFRGVLVTDNGGNSYRPMTGLPERAVSVDPGNTGFGPKLYRDVLDLWQNPRRPNEIVALNKHEVLFTEDGGSTFRTINIGGDFDKATFNTIAGRTNNDGEITEIFIGTYIRGIARCTPLRDFSGLRCRQMSKGMPFLKHEQGSYFVEEVSGMALDSARNRLYALSRFQAAINVLDLSERGERFESYALPGFGGADHAESLWFDPNEDAAYIATNRGVYVFTASDKSFRHIPRSRIFPGYDEDRPAEFLASTARGEGRLLLSRYLSETQHRTPSNLRALYISPTSVRSKRRTVFDLIDNYGFNAAVIDVKDDFGRLTYGSELPLAKEMNNDRARVDVRGLLKQLKERGVYTIARQVVFKDPVLFKYKNNAYAIRDRHHGGPWVGNEKERWVDTYSSEVHDYNVSVARELAEIGFDEIQFDYIRFPSDGPIGRCRWSHRPGDAYKSEALESFLMKARRSVSKPISVDIYGYHGIYRAGTVIGQDLIDVGEFVDVVSPMHYSSHFGNNYLDHFPRDVRAYELLKLGTERPLRMTQGRVQIRPWVQAFRMKISIWGYGEPYMRNQILGSVRGGADGFLWWGPIKEFYIPGRVHVALEK